MNYKSLFFLLILGFISSASKAQNNSVVPDFITDRPDQTESPNAVPVKYFQVETGFQYEKFQLDSYKFRNYTYNTTLLRYGLFKDFELRLGVDLLNLESDVLMNEFDPSTGFSPLLFGIKYELVDEDGWIPQIGVLAHALIPLGTTYDSGELGGELRLAFSHSLSEQSSLSYNLGFETFGGSDLLYFYTLSYGYKISEPLGLYAEVYADILDADFDHYWNAGFTYLVGNNVQLDGYVGTGINTNQDLLLGAGVSFRIPN